MWRLKHYRFGFDPWGLGLFLVIMLPNFVWFALPAPNDVLRGESVTPLLDTIAQALQAVLTAALCVVVNITRDRPMRRGYLVGITVCVAVYLAGWAAYYVGIVGFAVVLTLCLAPCGAFLLFALARKNGPALLSAGGFTACHLIFAMVNFL